jgi:LuxR family maltose regulon positive regulatory protein
VLAALADAARATGATAAHHLLKASTLAEPEGYRRVFLDEGPALREPLVESRRLAACLPPSPETPRLVAYIDGLLAELPDPSDSGQDVHQIAGCPPGGDVYDRPGRGHAKTPEAPTVGPYPITGAGLVEPLTGRELEVLELLAAGLSNRAIADRLCISLNTLQRHTSNLYGKLGVHSRMQAVLAARQLGLLAG